MLAAGLESLNHSWVEIHPSSVFFACQILEWSPIRDVCIYVIGNQMRGHSIIILFDSEG